MPIEIQQALIGLGGSVIGALIGSGVIGYLFNIRKEKTDADRRTYFFVKSMVSNNQMTHLRDANFYDGIPKEIVDNIYEIHYWSKKPNHFNFHSKKLQTLMNKLLDASKEFAKEVPNKTIPNGSIDHPLITTMTDAARSDEKTRERNRRESDELMGVANAVYKAVNDLDTEAMNELRISPADLSDRKVS